MTIDKHIRNNIITQLNNIINNDKLAKEVENSIYNFSKEYAETNELPGLIQSIYESKFSDINDLFNKNKNILEALKNNKYDVAKLAYYKLEELDPDTYEHIIQKREYKKNKKNNEGVNTFTCTKCKEAHVEITQRQTRAGDEPPTIFVKCLKCGHTFKF